MKSETPIFALLLCTACGTLPSAAPMPAAAVSQGKAIAQTSCGGCHAIERVGLSPYSPAPPFKNIVNREGLTADTLFVWLRGAHNYPTEMDFELDERDVDALVPYMLALRTQDHKRAQD